MSINTIASTSSLNYWQQEAKARTDYNLHSAAGTFGQILAKLTSSEAAADSADPAAAQLAKDLMA